MKPDRCLLCHSVQVRRLETQPAAGLIQEWQTAFQIDIRAELRSREWIELYECAQCALRFFDPELTGSAALYAKLQMFDWYYMAHKWEHTAALRVMRPGCKVLEVGCGRGDFVQTLTARGCDATGIELNDTAVAEGRRLHRNIQATRLEAVAASQPGQFDVVCAFQVLEHVPDPARFIADCLQLLKPAGCLALSVPNSAGFYRLAPHDLLNTPPHHLTRWSPQVLAGLPRLFPVKLQCLQQEPLAAYHLAWYANLQLDRLPDLRYVTPAIRQLTRRVIVPLVRVTRAYRFLEGHSLLACYQNQPTAGRPTATGNPGQ